MTGNCTRHVEPLFVDSKQLLAAVDCGRVTWREKTAMCNGSSEQREEIREPAELYVLSDN